MQKKLSLVLIAAIIGGFTGPCTLSAQNNKILVADYTMTQYSSLKNDSMPGAPHELVETVRGFSKETGGHYRLLYSTQQKIYIFKLKDIFISDMGGANVQFSALSNLKYSIFFQRKAYIKDDLNNANIVYSYAYPDSMKAYWKITNEKRRISGLSCTKAFFQFHGYKAIAWFCTEEIPVVFSPDLYVGLPGFVVQLEDGERTFVLDNIKYADSSKEFESEYSRAYNELSKQKSNKIKSVSEVLDNRKKMVK